MKQQRNNRSRSSMSNETRLTIVLVLMGIGILLLITLVAFALRGDFSSLNFSLPARATFMPGSTAFVPTLFIPTPDCGSPTLVIGTTAFQIENTSLAPDGTVSVPPDTSGVAYWVEGTDLQYNFLLSPTQENIALISSLPEGTTAKATWSNCNSMTFTLSTPQPGMFTKVYLPDQSTASMLLFVQTDASGNGLVIGGGLTEEEIATFNNPPAASGEVLAEIGLLETTSNGNDIQTKVSIYNFGSEPITLAAGDVSLAQPDGAVIAVDKSSPRLPETVKPGETKEFTLTFPRPATPTAVLKVFTVEYDVEGY